MTDTPAEHHPSTVSQRIAHAVFRVGIALKGIDGVLELIGAVILVAASPARLNRWVRLLTVHELSEDPSDFVATHLRLWISHVSSDLRGFACLYLLVHGLIKTVLAVSILRGRIWAYPWAMAFIGTFAAYSAYRAVHSHSILLGALALLDVVIVVLLRWERRRRGLSA